MSEREYIIAETTPIEFSINLTPRQYRTLADLLETEGHDSLQTFINKLISNHGSRRMLEKLQGINNRMFPADSSDAAFTHDPQNPEPTRVLAEEIAAQAIARSRAKRATSQTRNAAAIARINGAHVPDVSGPRHG
ncbi:MAG TPA: hypothetical protein VFU07_05500 [Candidatus Lumbricidophila sp.]|nr:hypothetical protein [Candidatus Lumbricidophila sp.]